MEFCKNDREVFIYNQRISGRSFVSIAAELGISNTRVASIFRRIELRSRLPESPSTDATLCCDPLDRELASLHLSPRTFNCLRNMGLGAATVRSLLPLNSDSLLMQQNFGRKSLNELQDVVRELIPDFTFGGDTDRNGIRAYIGSDYFNYPGHEEEAFEIIVGWYRFLRQKP